MAAIKRYAITKPWLPMSCDLGEAPFHRPSTNTLRFFDIAGQQLYQVDLAAGPSSLTCTKLPFSIGRSTDLEGENDDWIVFGGKKGFGFWNLKRSREYFWLKQFWTDEERRDDGGGKHGKGWSKEERMRANDGMVDANGRFWLGTMNDPVVVGDNLTNEGVLFRLDPDLSLHRMKTGLTIPNGISWSLDNTTMYLTDSPSGEITSYPYDLASGIADWSAGRTFFKCPYAGAVPDGHAQDIEGHLWVALFGAGRVVRVNPQGAIVAEITLPTRCVTCPAFCGTELVITSAQEEEPQKFPESKGLQGAVFKIDVGIEGRPLTKFRLEKRLDEILPRGDR